MNIIKTKVKQFIKKITTVDSPISFGKSISFDSLEEDITSSIDDIAFFRDISNDFSDDSFKHECNELTMLDKYATAILKDSIRIQSNSEPFCLAIVGNFSSGKSAFINSLLGEDICPEDIDRTTSSVTRFVYSPSISVWQIIEKSGQLTKKEITNQEYQQLVAKGSIKKNEKLSFEYRYPWEDLRDITIIDTPGFSSSDDIKSESGGDSETTEEIIASEADVLFWVIDIHNGGIKRDELERLDRLVHNGAEHLRIYIILNKADLKPHVSQRTEIRRKVIQDTKQYAKDVHIYSARMQKKSNISGFEKLTNEFKNQLKLQVDNPKDNWQLTVDDKLDPINGHDFTINKSSLSYDLSIDESGGLSRGEILNKLNELKAIKPAILSTKLKREQRKYISLRKTTIKDLSLKTKTLIKRSEKDSNSNSTTDIENALDNWKKDICHNLTSKYNANLPEEVLKIMNDNMVFDPGWFTPSVSISFPHLTEWINDVSIKKFSKIFTPSTGISVKDYFNQQDVIPYYENYCSKISNWAATAINEYLVSESKGTKHVDEGIQYLGVKEFSFEIEVVKSNLEILFKEFIDELLHTIIVRENTENSTNMKLKIESLKAINFKLNEYIKENKLC
jgi:GTPase SAR1 family protein